MILLLLLAVLFAIFPLTDTDIWWHMACAREWVTAWTPVRGPVVNVHEYFQQVVYAVYCAGGAPLLVAFKALLWGGVFALFLVPAVGRRGRNARVFGNPLAVAASAVLLFVFRYQMEMRPVVFTLLFLGVYWNAVPWLLARLDAGEKAIPGDRRAAECARTCLVAIALLVLQWLWCRFQGLYILGPLFALLCLADALYRNRPARLPARRFASVVLPAAFFALLFAMPFLHADGLRLFLYPFGLLDRLLGLTPSAAIFASEIAENRSPLTLLLARENVLASALMVVLAVFGAVYAVMRLVRSREKLVLWTTLFVTAVLALVAERNFVLLLPLLVAMACSLQLGLMNRSRAYIVSVVIIACLLGFWAKSLTSYDKHMVAYQRVPVNAAAWMAQHPHSGRLFNDDRAGGYLAFVNPRDSIYMDGRFILKSAEFFARYLSYAREPETFLRDADSLGVDRAVFPLRFYARWGALLGVLRDSPEWDACHVDDFYIVFCKK
ncbi:hypothetical protein SAMN05720781_2526 [Fibrobacter sp. UWT3]|uniref:hypothetical protein n=1 Tax=Fibrobacter sp. UWT3 TaxID=1896225 RepID=UPI000BC9616A|nr:hypothetical protein [Fibrobacter sp. UWT3]SOE78421.1 hypothetical protein SAMN05720781_2526 [Fibrobacter sp. UWT3]